MSEAAIFRDQDKIAASWGKQISEAKKEREAAKARGERTGPHTRHINDMEAMLAKLLAKGVRE